MNKDKNMIRRLLLFVFIALVVLSTYSQTTSANSQELKIQVFNIPNLPVYIQNATLETFGNQTEFKYSATNLTDTPIWNYEVSLYFFDAKSKNISKKVEVCIDGVTDSEATSCRHFPPIATLDPHKTEELCATLDKLVESQTMGVAVIQEVRSVNLP